MPESRMVVAQDWWWWWGEQFMFDGDRVIGEDEKMKMDGAGCTTV